MLPAILILAGVSLIGTMELTPEPVPTSGDLKPLPDEVDVALSRIRYTETHDGTAKWTLEADTAQLNLDAGETKIKNVQMTFFPGAKSDPVLLTARNGIINTRSGEVTASGDVGLLWGGGNRLATDRLHYRDAEGLIVTDEPVNLVIGPSTVAGKGLRLFLETFVLEIPADVHARFPIGRSADNGQ